MCFSYQRQPSNSPISWNSESEKNERKTVPLDKARKKRDDDESWEDDEEESDNYSPFDEINKQAGTMLPKDKPE